MAKASVLRDLLNRQADDLRVLDDRTMRSLLEVFEDSRRALRAELGDSPLPATEQHLRIMLAQSESAVQVLRGQLREGIEAGGQRSAKAALDHLVKLADKAERTFAGHGARVEVNTLARLATAGDLTLARTSIDLYGSQLVADIHRTLVRGLAEGLTQRALAERIAGLTARDGPEGVFQANRGRAALIVRMELSRAYDAGAQASLEELAALDDAGTDDPVLKKADEYLDGHNHPFSRLLDGHAVLPRQEWEIPTPPRARAGLVWRVTADGVARGTSYPAHFGDRGRQVPWRASWGGETWTPQPSTRRISREKQREAKRGSMDPALMATGLVDHLGRPTAAAQALNPG